MTEPITSKNCHFCSDPVDETEGVVRRVDVWRDDEEGIMPAFIATGEVAHRSCANVRSMNEEQIERMKKRFQEAIRDRTIEIVPSDPNAEYLPPEIPGQEKLFDGNP